MGKLRCLLSVDNETVISSCPVYITDALTSHMHKVRGTVSIVYMYKKSNVIKCHCVGKKLSIKNTF